MKLKQNWMQIKTKDKFMEDSNTFLSNKLKIVHIHSNHAFVSSSSCFENEKFQNEFIYLGKEINYNGLYASSLSYYSYSPNDLNKVIQICNKSDIVVLYNLDFAKSYISNRLDKEVMIFWRFFGEELYSRLTKIVLSNSTLENLKFKTSTKEQLIKLVDILRFKTTKYHEFEKSLDRINYFLGLAIDEYYYLDNYFDNLPEFIQLPYLLNQGELQPFTSKKNRVIVGNNRSPYNNHLDIINIISRHSTISDIEFLLLFNYGQENDYTEKVLQESKNIGNLKILYDYLPFSDFQKMYEDVGALVINSYRQMAMANIFTAIRSGVKVYLNSKNEIYHWLVKEEFFVFSIEEFEIDLSKSELTLTKNQVTHNIKQIETLKQKYNVVNFHETISQLKQM